MSKTAQHTGAPLATMEFDYIVIGAGSAGCTVASRLTEDPSVTVALLEAGPHDHHYSVWTPIGLAGTVPKAGPRNYAYYTEPQPGLDGRGSYQPRGKGLGGSSSINAMIYIRGHCSDYDHWAALGCHGWAYDDVLPYFRRSERNQRTEGRDDDPWHGGDGPLHVSDVRSPNPFSQRFVKAAVQAGVPLNDDFNGKEQEGVGLYQVTQRNGERWNTARAYLHGGNAQDSAMNGGRKGLAVFTGTQALRVVFEGKRAVGVSAVRAGEKMTLRARREVIVSGGAFNSPQLLLASGIGPSEQLRSQGIAVVHDLPGVGENLQDHLDVIITKTVNTTDLFGYSLPGFARMLREMVRYRRDRTGMFTSNFAEAGAFVKTKPDLAAPDVQLHFATAVLGNISPGKRAKPKHGYSCHACVLRPKSRGFVRLRSPDTREMPVIDPRFLSAEEDMEGMVAGVRLMRKIFAQPALAVMGGVDLQAGVFGPNDSNDEAIRQFVRSIADSIYHPIGTCKMGTDNMAVVDPSLRVHGVQGLRVVDASVMPTLVGGNTNAPAIMIAEKVADMIRADYW